MAAPTAQEQLFLELINRARLDPLAEATRHGLSDLNAGLPAGTISTAQKQVLTFNEFLNDSADGHTGWMLAVDVFSHTGSGNTNPGQRMAAAGYDFSGTPSTWGENLAWAGSTGAIDANAYVHTLHKNLFLSFDHRKNTMKEAFKEVGVGAAEGKFGKFNSLMVTQNFAVSGPDTFVTGVAYNDSNGDNFYSVGEGQGGITTELRLNSTLLESTDSWLSGGYSLETASTGMMHITFSGGGLGATMGATFAIGATNAKLDLVNGNTVQASVSATLTDASLNLTLLGTNGTDGTGNELANIIKGNSGANSLEGRGGSDTLDGKAGGDTYLWQSGDGSDVINDTSTSLSETDILILTNVASTGVELYRFGNDLKITIIATGEILTVNNQFNASNLGDGIETLSFSDSVSWNVAAIASHLAPPPPINGTAGADVLIGAADVDYINGFGSEDILRGMGGADVLDGGEGADTTSYAGSGAGVTVDLASSAASGGDAAGDTFISIENITGSSFNDTLTGDVGNNRLDGGAGLDTMAGGAGDDTYVVDVATDKVTEISEQGIDTIETALASFSLAALTAVENLAYAGTGNFIGTGNALDNTIRGGNGNDTLNGGLGADNLIGSAGNDTYVVDNAGDVVDEGTGAGTDLVQAAASFDLAATLGDVENLTLTGSASVNGTGNGLANTIVGNSGANVIEGKGGNDILDGGAGADTMNGGLGSDTYVVDSAGDVVSEIDGDGIDLVQSSVSFSLSDGAHALGDIESLTLTGGLAINGTGNALDNIITGNAAANIIDGGAGADAMNGGAGNDTYVVDNLLDVITEALTGGTDLAKSSIDYSLAGTNVENLTLVGIDNIGATGNGLANILTGNAGNNRLDGGVGIDTMIGDFGDDTYVVDNAKDKITETLGNDTIDTAMASFSLKKFTAIENLTYDNGIAADGSFIATGNALANRITGGAGNDKFTGGAGGDTFIFNVAAFGNDQITDYQDNLDKLSFSLGVADSFDDFVITGNGTKSVTVTHGTDSIVLTAKAAFMLDDGDFIFV